MINVSKIAKNLDRRKDGVWFSRRRSHISYPKDGNLQCLAIEDNSFWFEHRNKCIIEAIHRFPPDGAVWDVGAGNGHASLGIKNAGLETVVVEPRLQGAMNAYARGLSPVICSTLEDAGLKPHSIPAIGLFDVLEHIEDDNDFLRFIETLLIPNGRLYLTVPAYNLLWSIEDDHAGHYRRYTTRTLTRMLESIGFKIDFKTYIFSVLPLPVLVFRTLPGKLGLRKHNRFERNRKEHGRKHGLYGHLLNWILDKELSALKNKRVIAFGGSCLLVARSPSHERLS